MEKEYLKELVDILPGFKAAVDIEEDLRSNEKIKAYIPTENGVKLIGTVLEYLNPLNPARPILLTGTYGTGKSHLGLAITSLLTRDMNDEVVTALAGKIRKWPNIADKLVKMKESYAKNPYLFVCLEAEPMDFGPGFIDSALVLALKKALTREGLDTSIVPETSYDAAIKRIEEIEKNHPSALEKLKAEMGNYFIGCYSMKTLKSKLKNHNKEVLNDFRKVHPEISAGASFDGYSGVRAGDAYRSVVKELSKTAYSGIIVIWDEFTPVLKKIVEHPIDNEAQSLQSFAQACESTRDAKIIFMPIAHRTIQELIDIVSKETYRESIIRDAEKIAGRFRVQSLGHLDKETYCLMANVIRHTSKGEEFIRRNDERMTMLSTELEELNLFFEVKKKEIVRDLFPLHPLTTYCLAQLTERIGQRDRTVFTFLCDIPQQNGLRNFLERTTTDSDPFLPIFLPHKLLDYFLPIMRGAQESKKVRKLVEQYEKVKVILGPDDKLGDKVLQTLLVFSVVENIVSTTEMVSFAFNKLTTSEREEIEEKLNELKKKKIITQQLADKGWRFYGQDSGRDIDEDIKETIKENEGTGKTPVKILNESVKELVKERFRVIKAVAYNADHDLERKIELKFCTSSELSNSQSLEKEVAERFLDGICYVILGDSERELEEAERIVKDEFREKKQLLFTVPINSELLSELIPWIKRWQAIYDLPVRHEVYRKESRDELESEKTDLSRALKERLEALIDPKNGNMKWIWKGEEKEIRGMNRLEELASSMMKEVFPYAPPISREELVNENKSDTFRKYRIPIIDNLLQPDGPERLAKEVDTVRRHIIDAVYTNNGVLRKEYSKWLLAKPVDSSKYEPMVKTWEVIDRFVTPKESEKQAELSEFSKLIDGLQRPPFGLKKRTISLILAVVIRKYCLNNNIVFVSSPKGAYRIEQKVTGELLEEMIKNPSKWLVAFREITLKDKEIIEACAEVFGAEDKDLESVAKAVSNWWRNLPRYAQITKEIAKPLKTLREDFFKPLTIEEKSFQELFYQILPNLVGLDDLSAMKEKEVFQKIRQEIGRVKSDFEQLLDRLKNKTKDKMTEVGLGKPEEIIGWYNNLSSETKEGAFAGDSKVLIKWAKEVIEIGSVTIEKYVSLAENLIRRKVEDWNDEQVAVFKGHLESAKGGIDSWQPSVLPPGGKKKTDTGSSELPRIEIEGGNASKISKPFHLYEPLDQSPNKDQVKILHDMVKGTLSPCLSNGQITADEFVSIIYHLLKELL